MRLNFWSSLRLLSLIGAFLILGFACQQASQSPAKPDLSSSEQKKYLQKGQAIARASTQALGQALKSALKSGGVAQALGYCNLKAIALIDSLSQAHQVVIKRTSLKVRNPIDEADPLEKAQLQAYEADLKASREPADQLLAANRGQIIFTAPIMIQPLCLNCHGSPGQQIQDKDHQLIQSLYPEDQAINYKEGELRGMWSIRFFPNNPGLAH